MLESAINFEPPAGLAEGKGAMRRTRAASSEARTTAPHLHHSVLILLANHFGQRLWSRERWSLDNKRLNTSSPTAGPKLHRVGYVQLDNSRTGLDGLALPACLPALKSATGLSGTRVSG